MDSETFRTNDGVQLSYRDSGGEGMPLVMLHGWSQTQAMFGNQLRDLGSQHRVITLDFRGHGESENAEHGYRIARLASDVRDLLDHLELAEVHALGWSMGASVLWGFIDMFGTSRLRSLVVVDQPSVVASLPWMSEQDAIDTGGIMTLDAMIDLSRAILTDSTDTARSDFVRSMFTRDPDPELWSWVREEVVKLPAPQSVSLLFDHCTQDWRDVLARIDVPVLVTGGDGSHVDPRSQLWTAERIPNAKTHVFTADECGSHFPFLENAEQFNAVIGKFLDEVSA